MVNFIDLHQTPEDLYVNDKPNCSTKKEFNAFPRYIHLWLAHAPVMHLSKETDVISK